MQAIVTLFLKDLRIELRTREALVVLVGLCVLLSLVVSFGVSSASINPAATERIFPTLWWMIFLFSATVTMGRSLEFELESSALDRILLSGVSASAIYVSKLLCNFLLGLGLHIFSLFLLSGLLGVIIGPDLFSLVFVAALVVLGYTALAVVLAALAATSRLKNLLLPLVLIPLLFPLLLCGLELTSAVLDTHSLPWNSPWVSLVIVLDVLYITLGINLYPFAVKG